MRGAPNPKPTPKPRAKNEDYILMPKALTAENGAKALLVGEFKTEIHVICHDCCGSDEHCETCHGEGELTQCMSIDWTTIKAIYSKCVEHLERKP